MTGDAPRPGGLTLRAMVPNAITAAALCAGLTGIRFAITGDFEKAVLAVVLAGLLDGIDGRIARALKAQSRFGAELDSLADNVSFGVAPALILFMWSLQDVPRFGWFASLAFAVCMSLRLARFNARIDMPDEPRKQAGFLTGVPAPVGAGLAFLPLYLSFETDLGWVRRHIRLEVIGLFGLVLGGGLLTETWWTLIAICAVYVTLLPVGMIAYSRVRRQRAAAPDAAG